MMKNIFKFSLLLTSLVAINSCAVLDKFMQKNNAPLQPLTYLEKAPKVNVKDFFDGDLEGFAIIQDANGKIENSFIVKVDGKWEENKGTVRHNYIYNGGKKDSRTWLITVNDPENYTAIGHDFIAPGQGRQFGNASQVIYTLTYPYKDKKEKIDFEDNLYLVDENSAIIISEMKLNKNLVGKSIISLKKVAK